MFYLINGGDPRETERVPLFYQKMFNARKYRIESVRDDRLRQEMRDIETHLGSRDAATTDPEYQAKVAEIERSVARFDSEEEFVLAAKAFGYTDDAIRSMKDVFARSFIGTLEADRIYGIQFIRDNDEVTSPILRPFRARAM